MKSFILDSKTKLNPIRFTGNLVSHFFGSTLSTRQSSFRNISRQWVSIKQEFLLQCQALEALLKVLLRVLHEALHEVHLKVKVPPCCSSP